MSKHTPGPWQAEQAGMNGKIIEWFVRVDGDDIAIASAICDRAGNISEANARLIAAAPDLLEALEQTLQLAIDWEDEARGTWQDEALGFLHNDDPIIKKARAAIAKAKGEI